MYVQFTSCVYGGLSRSSHWSGVFLQYSQENTYWGLILTKSQASGPATLLKKTPTHVFSFGYCKIFKNTYLEKIFGNSCFCLQCSIKDYRLLSIFIFNLFRQNVLKIAVYRLMLRCAILLKYVWPFSTLYGRIKLNIFLETGIVYIS